MHKSNIINLIIKFPHSLYNSIQIYLFLYDMVMLINHNMVSFSKLLHNIFNILSKATPILSLNYCIFFTIIVLYF
jgi:hypothetical protein